MSDRADKLAAVMLLKHTVVSHHSASDMGYAVVHYQEDERGCFFVDCPFCGEHHTHHADGTNVPCESVMEARWAITQEVWLHQLFLDEEHYCHKNGLPVAPR